MPTSQDDPHGTRIHDLEQEMGRVCEKVAFAERTIRDMAEKFDTLAQEVTWLRQRFASFQPERHYCPHCRATVHRDARACGACGKSWGAPPDPKAGLPA